MEEARASGEAVASNTAEGTAPALAATITCSARGPLPSRCAVESNKRDDSGDFAPAGSITRRARSHSPRLVGAHTKRSVMSDSPCKSAVRLATSELSPEGAVDHSSTVALGTSWRPALRTTTGTALISPSVSVGARISAEIAGGDHGLTVNPSSYSTT